MGVLDVLFVTDGIKISNDIDKHPVLRSVFKDGLQVDNCTRMSLNVFVLDEAPESEKVPIRLSSTTRVCHSFQRVSPFKLVLATNSCHLQQAAKRLSEHNSFSWVEVRLEMDSRTKVVTRALQVARFRSPTRERRSFLSCRNPSHQRGPGPRLPPSRLPFSTRHDVVQCSRLSRKRKEAVGSLLAESRSGSHRGPKTPNNLTVSPGSSSTASCDNGWAWAPGRG